MLDIVFTERSCRGSFDGSFWRHWMDQNICFIQCLYDLMETNGLPLYVNWNLFMNFPVAMRWIKCGRNSRNKGRSSLCLSGAIANSGCWVMLSGMTLAACSGGPTTDCSPAVDVAKTLIQVQHSHQMCAVSIQQQCVIWTSVWKMKLYSIPSAATFHGGRLQLRWCPQQLAV